MEKTRKVEPGKMPLVFIDMDGKPVDLASYKGKSNVVLVMTKGMPQSPGGVFCPGCLAQMNAMVANIAEFKKREAEVLVVFPGPSEGGRVPHHGQGPRRRQALAGAAAPRQGHDGREGPRYRRRPGQALDVHSRP
ncbi:MAG: redoxin domain-containing protein [Gemmataceae bacterium]